MPINWNDNKLTPDIRAKLKQGTKVKFMWYGNKELVYTGRIEMFYDVPYWVQESNYKNDVLLYEGMRYYNSLDSFHLFTMFEIID